MFPVDSYSDSIDNAVAVILGGYSVPTECLNAVTLLLCGIISAVILPTILLTTAKYYLQEAQPIRLVLATSAAVFGKILAETNYSPGSSDEGDGEDRMYNMATVTPVYDGRFNLLLRLQGLVLAMVSLETNYILDTQQLESSYQSRIQTLQTWTILVSLRKVYEAVSPHVRFMMYY